MSPLHFVEGAPNGSGGHHFWADIVKDAMTFGPAHPWVEDSRAPLFVVTIPRGYETQDLLQFFRAVRNWTTHDADRPYGFVLDIGAISEITARDRGFVTDFVRSYRNESSHCAVQAIVARNPVVRGILAALFWLRQPDYPYQFFARKSDAQEWALSALKEALLMEAGWARRRRRSA